jgi:hypothetical protein
MSTNHHGLTSDDIPPAPFSEDELREQWNAQADVELNHWDNLGLDEQLGWAQARAIAADRAQRAPRDLPTPPVVESPAVEADPTTASAEPLWRVMEKAWEQRQAICAMLTTEAAKADAGGVITDTSHPPLSPAARAVVDAWLSSERGQRMLGDPACLAAALRAVADEIDVPLSITHVPGQQQRWYGLGVANFKRKLRAIAAELEGQRG